MREEAILIGFSQLGLVFAGFISIFLVFAKRDGRFSPADALRVRSIIYASFMVVLGALAPIVLSAYDISGEMAWRAGAAIFIGVGVISTIDAARRHLAMTRDDRAEVGIAHSVVSWGLNIVLTAVMVGIVFGLGGAANYILSLTLLLAIAASNFITIALQRLL